MTVPSGLVTGAAMQDHVLQNLGSSPAWLTTGTLVAAGLPLGFALIVLALAVRWWPKPHPPAAGVEAAQNGSSGIVNFVAGLGRSAE